MLAPLLTAGRIAHERLMVDTCTIDHPNVGGFDDDTGDYTVTWSPVYTGACRVKGPAAGSALVAEPQAAGAEQTLLRHTVVLPHGSPVPSAGDRVTVTGGPLLGVVFTVVGLADSSTSSARSLLVERLFTGPDDGGSVAATVGDPVEDGGGP